MTERVDRSDWEYTGNRWAHSAGWRCVHCGQTRTTSERDPDPIPKGHSCGGDD